MSQDDYISESRYGATWGSPDRVEHCSRTAELLSRTVARELLNRGAVQLEDFEFTWDILRDEFEFQFGFRSGIMDLDPKEEPAEFMRDKDLDLDEWLELTLDDLRTGKVLSDSVYRTAHWLSVRAVEKIVHKIKPRPSSIADQLKFDSILPFHFLWPSTLGEEAFRLMQDESLDSEIGNLAVTAAVYKTEVHPSGLAENSRAEWSPQQADEYLEWYEASLPTRCESVLRWAGMTTTEFTSSEEILLELGKLMKRVLPHPACSKLQQVDVSVSRRVGDLCIPVPCEGARNLVEDVGALWVSMLARDHVGPLVWGNCKSIFPRNPLRNLPSIQGLPSTWYGESPSRVSMECTSMLLSGTWSSDCWYRAYLYYLGKLNLARDYPHGVPDEVLDLFWREH